MEILVCVKQVPDDSVEIALDPKTGAPALDGVTPVVNAFDTYALEMAVRLKEAAGGEVTVLSIGDESVKNSLKNCLAVGADYAYLAADDAYQNADPEVIAKELQEYDPRYPTIKSKMAARKKPIEELAAAEKAEAQVTVLKVYEPAKRAAGTKIKVEDPEEAVHQALAMMDEAKAL